MAKWRCPHCKDTQVVTDAMIAEIGTPQCACTGEAEDMELVASARRRRTPMVALEFHQAVGILDALGCGDDPVLYRHKEWNLSDLTRKVADEYAARDMNMPMAHRVHLTYSGGPARKNRGHHRIQGTLADMVRDRLRYK